MHTLGHILQSIHNLRRHVIVARLETTVTESLENRMRIAADTLDYIEKELERLEDQ